MTKYIGGEPKKRRLKLCVKKGRALTALQVKNTLRNWKHQPRPF